MHVRNKECMHTFWPNKPEGKKPLEKPMYKREVSIKINLTEVAWKSVDWLRIGTSGGLLCKL
jgi:hypothetical protein